MLLFYKFFARINTPIPPQIRFLSHSITHFLSQRHGAPIPSDDFLARSGWRYTSVRTQPKFGPHVLAKSFAKKSPKKQFSLGLSPSIIVVYINPSGLEISVPYPPFRVNDSQHFSANSSIDSSCCTITAVATLIH